MAIFCIIVAAVVGASYAPYMPEVFGMLTSRLVADVVVKPSHASPLQWVGSNAETQAAYRALAARAQDVRAIVGTGVLVTLAIGLVRRSISPEVATAACLFMFVTVVLLAGSLDRMNIGFVTAILLIGRFHRVARRVGTALYVAVGIVSITLGYSLSLIEERTESVIVATSCVMMFGWLIGLASGLVRTVGHGAVASAQ
jgi:hypothetical protein